MKIILTQYVPGLGDVGEVKEVADGYARNYLIPKGMARRATPAALKEVEFLKAKEAKRRERERQEALAIAEALKGITLRFEVVVGETGLLHGRITKDDVARALEEKLGREIDRRRIGLPEGIRRPGVYSVPLHLLPDVEPIVTVEVVPEGGALPTEEAGEGEAAEASEAAEEGAEGATEAAEA